MYSYYVNKNAQSNGDHEVHREGCNYLPEQDNREYLGDFSSCHEAVKEALRRNYDANGCIHCSNACHTQ